MEEDRGVTVMYILDYMLNKDCNITSTNSSTFRVLNDGLPSSLFDTTISLEDGGCCCDTTNG